MVFHQKGGVKLQQLVSFKLGNEEFGVDIIKVQEIMRLQEITQVPQMPGFVEGVINLRGNVIPIVNLRKKFGLEDREGDKQTRIIVVNVAGKKVRGFIVDAVEQVLRLSEEQIAPAPDVELSVNKEYLKGVGKLDDRLLILLDLDKLLTTDEAKRVDKLHKTSDTGEETLKPKKSRKKAVKEEKVEEEEAMVA